MDSIQNTKHTFFITDKNYTLPEENQSILILKYFDISKNRLFSFTTQNDQLFIILNQNTFGSAFFGNTVIIDPKYFIIKKFNPIFILIQIIYGNQSEEESKDKNKNIAMNDFIDTSAIIQNYEDKLKTYEKRSDLFNNNFDSIFKSSMKFVKNIFEKYSKFIEIIAEIKEIPNNTENDIKICARRCESKIYSFLNPKVNLNPEENKEIENSKVADQNERDILTKRKIYEKITILEPFLPNNIYKNYLKYKHIDFLNEDEISVLSNDSVNKDNKRKKTGEKDNKRKTRKKGKEEPIISKNQQSITDMFKMKNK